LGKGDQVRPTWGRGSGAKLFGAIALFAFATVLARSAEADDVPLRVCADPNNLPFSDSAGAGFENKIVGLVGAYLHRPLEFVWRAERRGFVREGLNAGECDLVAAIPSGARIALATRPYYRSTYVFVSKPGEPPVTSQPQNA
jgi:mxaJ protein